MKYSSTIIAVAAVLLASLPVADAAESVRGFTFELDINVPQAAVKSDQIAFEFYPGARIESMPVITNPQGAVVPSAMFPSKHVDGMKMVMVFDGSDGSRRYTLHYGGRGSANRPATRWTPRPSILMETRSKNRGVANDWRIMQRFLQESEGKTQGLMFVSNIWHSMNPFGPSDEFITIYRGMLEVKQDTRLRLFTASSDASFVVINGELAFSWPGTHTADAGVYGQHGKDMTLTKGRHTIEYYHVQNTGHPVMALGMIKDGKKEPEKIPDSMFVQTPRATVGQPRRKDGQPSAYFTWRQGELLLFDEDMYIGYRFQNSTVGEADSYLWNFGNGVTSTERNPHHVLFEEGPYPVRLTIRKGDHTDTCMIMVPFETPRRNATIRNTQLVEEYIGVIKSYPFDTLPGAVLAQFFELFDIDERPLVTGPLAEVINRRFPRSPLALRVRQTLAKYYSITNPREAIPFLEELSEVRIPDVAHEARVDLMELHLHRFRDFARVERLAASHISASGPKAPLRRIAIVKQGDVYLMQDELEKAEEKYVQAQTMAFENMPVREIDLRQGAFAETVNAHIATGHLRAARTQLLQWEADFPISKITGDFILVSSRYWEAVGDLHKALDNMRALIAINPLTPHLPQIELRMANAYRDLGDREKAIQLYQKIAKQYPRNPVATEAALNLRSMR